MGSVFAQLLDTLPMHQALAKIEQAFRPFLQASANDVRTYVRRLDRSSQYTQSAPAVPNPSRPGRERLWGWTHAGNPPNRIQNVDCRVRDYGYHGFRVFDQIELGRAEGRQLVNQVRIHPTRGAHVDLPLEERFVHSRFRMSDGYTGENSHWLWPLQARMDTGMVVAFAYELVQEGGRTVPQPYELNRDPESAAALEELINGSGSPNWGERVIRGNFMPTRSRRHAPSAEVGTEAAGRGQSSRVIVALSFAVFRERADFEPGGIAGMAKVFPQLMVKASTPLQRLEAAVRMKRPSDSSVSVAGTGDSHVGCGGDSERTITPLMVADANENAWALDIGPFWSDIFAYYDDDMGRIGNTRMHVIKRSGANNRRIESYGRRQVTIGLPQTTLTKKAGQGEFDSIHVAPSLRVAATHFKYQPLAHQMVQAIRLPSSPEPIPDRGQFHLDHVKMAPFCSHDCLHTHWRWGEGLSNGKRFVKGWSASAPYSELGAPMAQRNQDVYLTLLSKSEMLYEVDAGPVSNGQIPSYSWQVINHHGSGFVSGINIPAAFAAVRVAVDTNSATKLANGMSFTSAQSSSAVFYWLMRYEYNPQTRRVEERVQLTDSQRQAARNL
jgi:hypothetical protein